MKIELESSAVAVARQNFSEAPPSLNHTVAGQASTNPKLRMPSSFWKIEVLEQCEQKLGAEPAARTWAMYLKMLHKPRPVIGIASTR